MALQRTTAGVLMLLACNFCLLSGQELPGQAPLTTAKKGGGLGTNVIIMIVVCTVGGVIILGALGGLLWLCFKRRTSKGFGDLETAAVKSNHVAPDYRDAMDQCATQHMNEEYTAQLFLYKELQQATNDFSPTHLIGEGGFGRVYYAKLSDGRIAAVKQLDRAGRQGEKEFRVEVDLLSRLGSQFLLSLWGYCADDEHRVLVYGFMPNGSLQEHLFTDGRPGSPDPLDWATRLQIALDAARGLEYLHEVAQPTIIHRDFKSSNVLLDLNYRAKVSDFGLAKLSPDKGEYVSTRVLGTQGYVAPEYALTGHLTTKSDVYSYGVVLLELLTGRPPVDSKKKSGEVVLVPWVMSLMHDRKRLHEIVDPRLDGQYSMKDLTQLAAIATMCVQSQADYRPLMRDVVQSLLPLVKNSVRPTSGSQPGRAADSRRTEYYLAQIEADRRYNRMRNSDISENFVSREFTSEELHFALEGRYPGFVKQVDSRQADEEPDLPGERERDHVSDEYASDERSSPRGSPHSPDYDALSREASLESQKEQPPARFDDPGTPEEEERKKPMVHDGWKSTPSGQVYVSRDYDSSELRFAPGFDIGALVATNNYGRGGFTPPHRTPDRRGIHTHDWAGIHTPDRRDIHTPDRPSTPRTEKAHARQWSPARPPRPESFGQALKNEGLVPKNERFGPKKGGFGQAPKNEGFGQGSNNGQAPKTEGLGRVSKIEHDGFKSTPNGEIYVSRDYDSGEVKLLVEGALGGGMGGVNSSREGLLSSRV